MGDYNDYIYNFNYIDIKNSYPLLVVTNTKTTIIESSYKLWEWIKIKYL